MLDAGAFVRRARSVDSVFSLGRGEYAGPRTPTSRREHRIAKLLSGVLGQWDAGILERPKQRTEVALVSSPATDGR